MNSCPGDFSAIIESLEASLLGRLSGKFPFAGPPLSKSWRAIRGLPRQEVGSGTVFAGNESLAFVYTKVYTTFRRNFDGCAQSWRS